MGNIEITFLGTGTSQGIPVVACPCEVCHSTDPKDVRQRTACMVQTNNKTIVIDAGPDFRNQMLRNQVKRLDAILVTHAHRDHVGGLDDVRAFNYVQHEDMPIYGNKQALQWIKHDFAYAFVEEPYPGIPKFNLIEVNKTQDFRIHDIPITPIEVMHHNLPVLAYRIHDFTYITDAKTIGDEEIEKIRGTKVLVVNALRREEHFSHFTLDQAIGLIERIKPQRAYLTHISHYLGRHADLSAVLPVNVFPAYDNLQITL